MGRGIKKLSIIVPIHNSERFIRECIVSILNQTYQNIEIICIDSSKDGTLFILKELTEVDSRIQIVKDNNSSYGHKINVGVQLASGEYIAIVEADDYILPNMYQDMMDKLCGREVDFIKSNAVHFGTINGRKVFCTERKDFLVGLYDKVISLNDYREIAITGRPTIWTALYRREFLLENQLWLNESPGASYQDTSFVILVGLMAHTCIFIEDAYYCYRRDNENSSVLSKDKVDCVREEYAYVVNYLKNRGLYKGEIVDLIRKKKLITYNWNCLRLCDELAIKFISSINSEMQEYDAEMIAGFSLYEKNIYDVLVGKKSIMEHRQSIDDMRDMIDILLQKLSDNNRFVMIGVGKIGQRVLCLQKYMEDTFIDAIADNNINVINSNVGGYQVCAVKDVVKNYPDHTYIVANKKDALDIKKQLVLLGIASEKIICIKCFGNDEAVLMKCIEYFKKGNRV